MKSLATIVVLTLAISQAPAAIADCTPNRCLDPVTADLSSNRSDGLPNGQLQLAAFYDGAGRATINVQLAKRSILR